MKELLLNAVGPLFGATVYFGLTRDIGAAAVFLIVGTICSALLKRKGASIP